MIVSLLNRNPSKRLGAGPEGADEIKRHPFFKNIDWSIARERKLQPPKLDPSKIPSLNAATYVECSEEQMKKIYDDQEADIDTDIYENRTV